jgi:hypothetical protein
MSDDVSLETDPLKSSSKETLSSLQVIHIDGHFLPSPDSDNGTQGYLMDVIEALNNAPEIRKVIDRLQAQFPQGLFIRGFSSTWDQRDPSTNTYVSLYHYRSVEQVVTEMRASGREHHSIRTVHFAPSGVEDIEDNLHWVYAHIQHGIPEANESLFMAVYSAQECLDNGLIVDKSHGQGRRAMYERTVSITEKNTSQLSHALKAVIVISNPSIDHAAAQARIDSANTELDQWWADNAVELTRQNITRFG